MSKILIWCHGGCFGGGSVTNDADLRSHLTSQGWEIRAVKFPLDNYAKALNHIKTEAVNADFKTNHVVVGGISSGGFLAHKAAHDLHLPALLICPVMGPAARHYKLPHDLQWKQIQFFGTYLNMLAAQNRVTKPSTPTFVLYGTQDTRAEPHHFESWKGLENVKMVGVEAGHELCKSPDLSIVLEGLQGLVT
jgi:acetyl esterase/lipase